MISTSLERLLSRLPGVAVLHKFAPKLHSRLRRLFGPHAEPTWRTDDPEYMTLLLLDLELFEQARDRDERIHALEQDRAQLGEKLETSRAAELNWQAIAQTRGGIVFTNAVGQTVTISRNFLQAFADHHQLDVSSFEERGHDVVVLDGEEVIEQFPKTLFTVLPSVLDRCPWFPRRPASGVEGVSVSPVSPDSRPIPANRDELSHEGGSHEAR